MLFKNKCLKTFLKNASILEMLHAFQKYCRASIKKPWLIQRINLMFIVRKGIDLNSYPEA